MRCLMRSPAEAPSVDDIYAWLSSHKERKLPTGMHTMLAAMISKSANLNTSNPSNQDLLTHETKALFRHVDDAGFMRRQSVFGLQHMPTTLFWNNTRNRPRLWPWSPVPKCPVDVHDSIPSYMITLPPLQSTSGQRPMLEPTITNARPAFQPRSSRWSEVANPR